MEFSVGARDGVDLASFGDFIMRGKMWATATTAVAGFFLVGSASADPYSISSSSQVTCSVDTPDNCLDGISIGALSPDALRMISGITAEMAQERGDENATVMRGGVPSGLAAGEQFGNVSVWVNFMYSDFDSDFVIAPQDSPLTAYDSELVAGMFGIDTILMDRFVIGAAFGYEDMDTRTPFNGGDHEADGFSITPYAAFLINDHFSLDVSGGFAWMENDQTRIDRQGAVPLSASFDSDRRFIAANLSAFTDVNKWSFGGTLGILYTEQTEDGYTEQGSVADARTVREREIDLTQMLIGGDVSYRPTAGLEAFSFLNYRNDLSRDEGRGVGGLPGDTGNVQPDDEDEIEFGVGARFQASDSVSGNIEFSHIFGREDFDSWTGASPYESTSNHRATRRRHGIATRRRPHHRAA